MKINYLRLLTVLSIIVIASLIPFFNNLLWAPVIIAGLWVGFYISAIGLYFLFLILMILIYIVESIYRWIRNEKIQSFEDFKN